MDFLVVQADKDSRCGVFGISFAGFKKNYRDNLKKLSG